MKIKVFEKVPGCFPVEFEIGEWYDLKTSKDVWFTGPAASTLKYSTKKHPKPDEERLKKRNVEFQSALIPLGICMQLPKGYEAVVVPRSSTFGKYGLLQTNSFGVIDCSYCSEKDEWKFPAMATRDAFIPKYTRIAQFKVQLSQKASFWQKLRWLFSKPVRFVDVDHLDNEPRGGFGEGTDKIDNSKNNTDNETKANIKKTVRRKQQ